MYRKVFFNENFKISISSNSMRVMKSIDNFLDFKDIASAKSKIVIEFYINEVSIGSKKDPRGSLYSGWNYKDKILSSSLGIDSVMVRLNPRTRVVHVDIFQYLDSQKERILDFILFQPLRVILAHQGLFSMHVSVAEKDNTYFLIGGSQHCGKSTLAMTLLESGFNFICDDDCFVRSLNKKIFLYPFPTKLGLNDKMFDLYPGIHQYLVKNYRYGDKRRFSLVSKSQALTGTAHHRTVMIFPKYNNKQKSIGLKSLSIKEAFNRTAIENLSLYSQLNASQEISGHAFLTLYALVKQSQCFELNYNEALLGQVSAKIQAAI